MSVEIGNRPDVEEGNVDVEVFDDVEKQRLEEKKEHDAEAQGLVEENQNQEVVDKTTPEQDLRERLDFSQRELTVFERARRRISDALRSKKHHDDDHPLNQQIHERLKRYTKPEIDEENVEEREALPRPTSRQEHLERIRAHREEYVGQKVEGEDRKLENGIKKSADENPGDEFISERSIPPFEIVKKDTVDKQIDIHEQREDEAVDEWGADEAFNYSRIVANKERAEIYSTVAKNEGEEGLKAKAEEGMREQDPEFRRIYEHEYRKLMASEEGRSMTNEERSNITMGRAVEGYDRYLNIKRNTSNSKKDEENIGKEGIDKQENMEDKFVSEEVKKDETETHEVDEIGADGFAPLQDEVRSSYLANVRRMLGSENKDDDKAVIDNNVRKEEGAKIELPDIQPSGEGRDNNITFKNRIFRRNNS